jgi:hypothetical protein
VFTQEIVALRKQYKEKKDRKAGGANDKIEPCQLLLCFEHHGESGTRPAAKGPARRLFSLQIKHNQ